MIVEENKPYTQVDTDREITMENGVKVSPIATLKDGWGGVAQWIIDDHCYVLCLKQKDGTYRKTTHLFKEAVAVLVGLLD